MPLPVRCRAHSPCKRHVLPHALHAGKLCRTQASLQEAEQRNGGRQAVYAARATKLAHVGTRDSGVNAPPGDFVRDTPLLSLMSLIILHMRLVTSHNAVHLVRLPAEGLGWQQHVSHENPQAQGPHAAGSGAASSASRAPGAAAAACARRSCSAAARASSAAGHAPPASSPAPLHMRCMHRIRVPAPCEDCLSSAPAGMPRWFGGSESFCKPQTLKKSLHLGYVWFLLIPPSPPENLFRLLTSPGWRRSWRRRPQLRPRAARMSAAACRSAPRGCPAPRRPRASPPLACNVNSGDGLPCLVEWCHIPPSTHGPPLHQPVKFNQIWCSCGAQLAMELVGAQHCRRLLQQVLPCA